MRFFFCLAGLLVVSGIGWAQDKAPPKGPLLKFEKTRVGFLPYDINGRPYYKPGMWAPVHIWVQTGEKPLPSARLILETIDNEDVGTISTIPLALDAKNGYALQAYARPGNTGAEVKISVETDNRTFDAISPGPSALDLQASLYLSLGARLPDLPEALMAIVSRGNKEQQIEEAGKDSWPLFAAFEPEADLLPDQVLGYDAVDLMFLATGNDKFLHALLQQNNSSRLGAIAQWVKQGGQLVIGVSWVNQAEVSKLLQHPVWQPPLPVQIPEDAGDVKNNAPQRVDVPWSNKPLSTGGKGIPLARLRSPGAPPADWDVLADTGREDGYRPLITRMAYGRGSITFLAFSLEQAPFTQWEGRVSFLQHLISKIGPRIPKVEPGQNRMRFGGGGNLPGSDLVSDLHGELQQFDVKVVPFGWVALFILLYILVVGPLDYLLLKYVFHRLEWTWITFPTVVLAVSVAAYFTAYAIKGQDLKINQVDILDFDLRTHLDDKSRPKKAYLYGQSFFAILSPRIQNYTIGLEPNAAFWSQPAGKNPPSSALVTWMSKPDDSYGGIGRPRTQSYFRRPYNYADDFAGLKGVPIPVWTTKAFAASWETSLNQLPFQVDLTYPDPQKNREVKLSGKFQNNLAVDLHDVWLFYGDKVYAITKLLPGKKAGSPIQEIELIPKQGLSRTAQEWATREIDEVDGKVYRQTSDQDHFHPAHLIKQLLFFEKVDISSNQRNQSLRAVDQSWRLKEYQKLRDTSLREAILYARARFRAGPGETLAQDAAEPLPTQLWLGDLPGPQKSRPALIGNLHQDTFIRILVPVRTAEN